MAEPVKKGHFIPLGLKIAGLVTGVVALLAGGFGWGSAELARGLVESEVNARGAELAQVLAQGISRVTQTESGRTWSVLFEDPPLQDVTGEWKFRRQQARKAWQQTFEKLCHQTDTLNIVIVERGGLTLSAKPVEELAFPTGADGTFRSVPARRFQEAILSPDGSTTFGHLGVYLSLKPVYRAKREILASITILGGGAVAVCTILSLFIGRVLARPARKLVEDMAVVRTGKLDHRTHIQSRDEIGLLADAFNEMTAGLRETDRLRAESEQVRHDMRLAHEIQTRLLPMELPDIPHFDIAACYEPALAVSGDYYDVFLLPDSKFAVTVGDVSGKGVSAALVMTMTRALLRMGALSGLAPKELLARINAVLFKDLKRGIFVTLAYAVVDPLEGTMTVASAGHNPVCLWLPDRGECMDIEVPGIALGVVEAERFAILTSEATLSIPKGGRVIIYTDGVTEAKDRQGRDFGIEAVHQLAAEIPEEESEMFVQSLLTAIYAHRKDAPPSDDIAVVTFRRSF